MLPGQIVSIATLFVTSVPAWAFPFPALYRFQGVVQAFIEANNVTPMSRQLTVAEFVDGERQIGIFAGLIRDVPSAASLLQDANSNVTLLAPTNSAMTLLPHKPWENANDYNTLGVDAYEGPDGQGRAQQNIRAFVEAHIVPQNSLKVGEQTTTLGGKKIWIDTQGLQKKVSLKVIHQLYWAGPDQLDRTRRTRGRAGG